MNGIFMSGCESRAPEIFYHDKQDIALAMPRRFGRSPQRGKRYYLEGFTFSKNGNYLATLHRNYLPETYREHEYELTVWDISQRCNFPNILRKDPCSLKWSKSFRSCFRGRCAQPLAFNTEDTLYCLSRFIKIGMTSTEEDPLLELSPVLEQSSEPLGKLSGLGHSSDGQYLITLDNRNMRLVRSQMNGAAIESVKTLSTSMASICCVSHGGYYVVWRDTSISRLLYLKTLPQKNQYLLKDLSKSHSQRG